MARPFRTEGFRTRFPMYCLCCGSPRPTPRKPSSPLISEAAKWHQIRGRVLGWVVKDLERTLKRFSSKVIENYFYWIYVSADDDAPRCNAVTFMFWNRWRFQFQAQFSSKAWLRSKTRYETVYPISSGSWAPSFSSWHVRKHLLV